MGIFDEIENLAKQNPDEVKNLTQQAEQFADQQTGGQFNSEIQSAGNAADQYLEGGQQGGQQQ